MTKTKRGIVTPTARKAPKRAPSSPMFNDAEAKIIVSALNTTWQQIASDAEGAVESNEGAVEVCIDADRLVFNCGYGGRAIQEGKDADAFITAAIKAHSYDKVLKELSKMVSFV